MLLLLTRKDYVMKLNCWYIQAVEGGYQAVRFTKRNGKPELGPVRFTVSGAREWCGDFNAELL